MGDAGKDQRPASLHAIELVHHGIELFGDSGQFSYRVGSRSRLSPSPRPIDAELDDKGTNGRRQGYT